MRGISIDAIMLSAVRVVTMLLGLACVKIVSVHFSLSQFGLYSQAMLIVSTVGSLTILGFSDGINYFYNSEKSRTAGFDKSNYVSTLFLLQTVIGIGAGFIIIIASPLLTDYFNNPSLSATYIWIALQPLMGNFIAMFGVLYISLGKTKLIALFNLLFCIFRLLIFLFSAFYTNNIITLIQLTLILDLAHVSAFLWFIRGKGISISFHKFNARLCRPIFTYCIPIAMFVLINNIMRDSDKWIVGNLGTVDDLAIYANASRIIPFDILMASFATVLIPIITRLANSMPEKAADILGHYLNLGLLTTTIFVGSALWLAKDLMLTLYDSKYLPGISVFIIFLFVDFIRFANISLIFNATGQTKHLLRIIFFTFTLNLILAIVLFKAIGIMGPAIGTFIATTTSNILFLAGGSKILKTSLFQRINLKQFIIIIAELLVTGFIITSIEARFAYDINPIIRFMLLYPLIAGITAWLNRRPILGYLKTINKS